MFQIRLKALREEAGFSQYSFADAFGVAQSTVGSWEAGKREPNFTTVQRLADFFNVSVDYLLGRTEQKNAPVDTGASEHAYASPSAVAFGDPQIVLTDKERRLIALYRKKTELQTAVDILLGVVD